TPLPSSSFRTPSVKDCTNALDALYTAWYGPGIFDTTDDVMSIRPEPTRNMSFSNRCARCTVERTLTSMTERTSSSSASTNAPPIPTPALSATAAGTRPPAVAASWTARTPSGVRRSAWTDTTSTPDVRRSAATSSSASDLAASTRSYPSAANRAASSRPMPRDAPVTRARGRASSISPPRHVWLAGTHIPSGRHGAGDVATVWVGHVLGYARDTLRSPRHGQSLPNSGVHLQHNTSRPSSARASDDAREELCTAAQKVFGWDTLRPAQLDAMVPLLDGRDVLAVMATGSGKSAIYQVPSLLLPGVTVVVSP